MDIDMYTTKEYVDVQSIISSLKRHPESQELRFAHSSIGDKGCEAIFRWLGENGGIDGEVRPKVLHVIDLNDVEMGDAGFRAMCDYLHLLTSIREGSGGSSAPDVNSHLRICLRYNGVQGSPELAQSFISAVTPGAQSSSLGLTSLILSNNPLSPSFKKELFGSLLSCAPNLLELRLDVSRLTLSDAEALAAYISDSRCQLSKFTANANSMGYAGVKRIVLACQQSYSLEHVEMYANGGDNPWQDVEQAEDDGELQDPSQPAMPVEGEGDGGTMDVVGGSGCGWKLGEPHLRRILIRNTFLKRQVQQEALTILRYARIMLPSNHSRAQTNFAPFVSDKPSPTDQGDPRTSSLTRFQSLPTEIQLAIFSFLGPHLSPAQFLNVVEFATDRGKLPRLFVFPPFSRRTSENGTRSENTAKTPGPKSGSLVRGSRGPGGITIAHKGKALPLQEPSFSSHPPAFQERVEERLRWFQLMGCECYDSLSTKRHMPAPMPVS